jgi:hypothetical protein
MSFKLEDLPYQRQAISAVVRLFDGQQRNYFDLQLQGDCFPNRLDLTRQEIVANLEKIAAENGISHGEASICIHPDYLVSYASSKSPDFEQFVSNQFSKLNSKISEADLYGYTKVFGASIHTKFGVLLTSRKDRINNRIGKNICSHYKQILSWRHDYAHAGIKNTTISEAAEFHLYAKRVLFCFDEAFR